MSDGGIVLLSSVFGIACFASAALGWKFPDWINNKNQDSLEQIKVKFPDKKRKYFVTGQYNRNDYFLGNLALVIFGLGIFIFGVIDNWPNTDAWQFRLIFFGGGLFFCVIAPAAVAAYTTMINAKLLAVTDSGLEIWSNAKGNWNKRSIDWQGVKKVVLIFGKYQGLEKNRYKIHVGYNGGYSVLVADWANVHLLYRDILNYAKYAKIEKTDKMIIEKGSTK